MAGRESFHPMLTRCLYVWAFLLAVPYVARADDALPAADDIPLVGRPARWPFSGASGVFEVEARAEPTALRAGEAITFTVTVRALAPVRHPPRRPDLKQLPEFADNFDVENPDESERRPDGRTWVFAYRLKPRRPDVGEVPGLPFVYFNPAIRPERKGFQTCFTEPIPLSLQAAVMYAPLPSLPDEIYHPAARAGILDHDRPPQPPGPVLFGLLIAAPPLSCGAWYAAWRSLYPDAARRTRQRRSRAAEQSLKMLRGASRLPPPQRASHAAAAVNYYLHARFDFAAAEPTPAEAAAALQRSGHAGLADGVAGLIRACDASRFSPAADGVALTERAERLILDAEAETWASS
jgi:hypothetical protein